jgi:twitching motility protein PilU
MDGKITQEEALANADSSTDMLWLINQATAGQISASGTPVPSKEDKKKDDDAAGGASFNDFKIDMTA